MNKLLKPSKLPYFTLAAGITGLLLQVWLFATGLDENGLLISGHPGAILSWALAFAGTVILFISTRGLGAPQQPRQPKRPVPGCIGSLAAAVGIGAAALPATAAGGDGFSLISGFLGIAAAVCLCLTGLCHLRKTLPPFWLYYVVVLYFLFHLVSQYRQWSWIPQLSIYGFPLLSSVFLMLACYHRCALDSSLGNWGSYLFFSQTAALLSCLAIPGRSSLFYPAMALWMLLEPFSLELPTPEAEDAP